MASDHNAYDAAMPNVTQSTQRAPGRRSGRVRRFRLRVVGGPHANTEMVSTGERLVIGTHRSADFHLVDKTMSRFHCEIVIEEGRAIIRDLGSLNGTIVDGLGVIGAYLGERAILTLGSTQVLFELGKDDDDIEIELHDGERFGLLVGTSRPMRAAMTLLARAAASDLAVLLHGETGTGKGSAAESIHREGPRRDGPFIVVDCASALGPQLERELFGEPEGPGAFEAASGGTLVLDEIGELPLELQPTLLRALENRQGARTRLIATTTHNLRQEVNARNFRSDLYYRLAVLEIALPPLRQRAEDLPLLVDALLRAHGDDVGEGAARLREPASIAELQRHAWPGNVRELANYVERCLAFEEPPPLEAPPGSPQSGAPRVDAGRPLRVERDRWLRRFEREYLEQLLAAHGGNVSAAARAAGVDRIHLYRLLWRAGLREIGAPAAVKPR
jgi:two-component system, NtrC family, response regulator GlrR